MKLKNIVVYYNPEKRKLISALNKVKMILSKRKANFGIVSSHSDYNKKCDIALSLGGDGTMLRVAQKTIFQGVPLLGINLGTLGFLAEIDYHKLEESIDAIIQNKIKIQERMVLDVSIIPKNHGAKTVKKHVALNDCVIKLAVESRVISITAYVNELFLTTYIGDGVIVATPTGSTAYSLAAQGPIVQPDMDLFIMTPICPHSLTQRPLIIDNSSKIKLHVDDSERDHVIKLSIDGQMDFELYSGDTVFIQKSRHKFLLATPLDKNYFQILRKKLNWGAGKLVG
ncbi:MAG: NAD(+)/NADH kinase [bacterium]